MPSYIRRTSGTSRWNINRGRQRRMLALVFKRMHKADSEFKLPTKQLKGIRPLVASWVIISLEWPKWLAGVFLLLL